MSRQLSLVPGPEDVFVCKIDDGVDLERDQAGPAHRRGGVRFTGRWVIAGTPLGQPYPCRCELAARRPCSPVYCPCAGRVDLAHVPAGCCGHRVRPHHAAAAARAESTKRRR